MRPSRAHYPPVRPSGAGAILETLRGRLLRLWDSVPGDVPRTLPVALLGAASRVYESALLRDQARLRAKRVRLPARVVSIGNITVGGTGKTPLTMWLCGVLSAGGLRPAVLSRGYGGSGKNPVRVPVDGDPRGLSALFGDEPVLMARELPSVPVWVGRERAASGLEALCSGAADVLLLDDGFQHLALDRDLDIVLLDVRNPFGNGFSLPLGPLREPVFHLARADAFVLTHADDGPAVSELKRLLGRLFAGKPVFSCRHEVLHAAKAAGGPPVSRRDFQASRTVAFAGIARPDRFFKSVEDAGATVCAALSFPDHHAYRDRDLQRILATAAAKSATRIVTTAKDAVRLPSDFRDLVTVLHIGVRFGADHEPFLAFLAGKLGIPEISSERYRAQRADAGPVG